ncbi:hypothetical protein [Flavobacterium enshiense]|uniref:Signal peptidase n=1 Tax=Flavobacterium enshiense DK69 TaxID=1107311 RepID=A0A0A2MXH2_9FLAO|nr:hypothetical protein [Flavobacterium enshiense]KGO96301.1 hypothetical protein Q767_05120 [Flavobacterium enshiense DK69]
MKSNLIKIYIFSILFMSDFAMFAQPGTDDGGGGLEDEDPPVAPINSKLFWLVLFGIILAFNFFRKRKNKTA